VEHAGGNFEPFVVVIGAYLLRKRPIWLGLLLGIGYLNREFSLLALIALVLLDMVNGQFRQRLEQRLLTVACVVPLVFIVQYVAQHSTSYFGPDAASQTAHPSWENVRGLFSQQLPSLLAAAPRTLRDFNITSSLTEGYSAIYTALVAWSAVTVVWLSLVRRLTRAEIGGFSAYLLLVGSGQAAAFVLLAPDGLHAMNMRYVLLVPLALMGLIGLAWHRPELRVITAGFVLVVTGANLVSHAKLIREYALGPPRNDLQKLAKELLLRNVRFGRADYWVAYDIDWLTRERVMLAPMPGQAVRMLRYEKLVSQNARQAFTISDKPCQSGELVVRWYLCPPTP
jgi:hypothetical protein